ncbi:hypothetical protein HPB47_015011 [Ixodes persulcatus]|uniref:Uncharacterized protein n=1 Tax=Ixodes persulcatus TaxID=34615 RepID=A0AC60QX12_IXOPE|nr:hypothetical protein HPB47_015011 [Ixodes persulcatus]
MKVRAILACGRRSSNPFIPGHLTEAEVPQPPSTADSSPSTHFSGAFGTSSSAVPTAQGPSTSSSGRSRSSFFRLQLCRLAQSRLFLVRPARTPPIQTLRVHVQTLARVRRPLLLFLRVPFQLAVPFPSPRVLQGSWKRPQTTAGPKPAGHPAAPRLLLRVLPVTVRQCWCRHL